MNNEIRNGFLELKITGQRSAITIQEKRDNDLKLIAYLKSLIDNNVVADFEDKQLILNHCLFFLEL